MKREAADRYIQENLHYYRGVAGNVALRQGRMHERDDLLQVGLLKLLEVCEKGPEDEENFRRWSGVVASNAMRDAIRHSASGEKLIAYNFRVHAAFNVGVDEEERRGQHSLGIPALAPNVGDFVPDDEPGVEEAVVEAEGREERAKALNEAFTHLTEREGLILILAYILAVPRGNGHLFLDFVAERLAELLDAPPLTRNAAKSFLFRAKTKLKAHYLAALAA